MLEPERRAIVILAESERLSVAEVAAVMDIDPDPSRAASSRPASNSSDRSSRRLAA